MNSIEMLQDKYGVLTIWQDHKPFFIGVFMPLKSRLTGSSDNYAEISMLMKDVEENWRIYQPAGDRTNTQESRY